MEDIDRDRQEHQHVYHGVVQEFNIVFAPSQWEPDYNYFTEGAGMLLPWLSISNFKRAWEKAAIESTDIASSDNERHIPIDYISTSESQNNHPILQKNIDSYEVLLTSIGQLMMQIKRNSKLPCFPPLDMNPLLRDMIAFILSEDIHPSLGLIFRLHRCVGVHRSFLWRSESATKTNCRLMALCFAQEMLQTTRTPLPPIRDEMARINTICNDLSLDSYLTEKRFDLYHQSP